MSKVTSVRWNDSELYQQVYEFARLNNQKINTIIMLALMSYIRQNASKVSKLRLQTEQFAGDDFSMSEWLDGYDTTGWEE